MNTRHWLTFAVFTMSGLPAIAFSGPTGIDAVDALYGKEPVNIPRYPDDGKVFSPSLVSMPHPEYPKNLRDGGIEGEAVLIVGIDENGVPKYLRWKSTTDVEFVVSALRAASNGRWEPYKINGKPSPV